MEKDKLFKAFEVIGSWCLPSFVARGLWLNKADDEAIAIKAS